MKALATCVAGLLVVGCVDDGPGFFIITPEQGDRYDGPFAIGVYLTAEGSMAGVASVDVSCDGAPVGTWIEGVTGIPCTPEGDSHGVVLRGVGMDANGDVLAERSVTIDWHQLIVLSFEQCTGSTCTPIVDGATLSGTVRVRAVLDHDLSHGRVGRFQLDGAATLIGEDHAAPFEVDLDTTALTSGGHTLASTLELDNGDFPYGVVSFTVAN